MISSLGHQQELPIMTCSLEDNPKDTVSCLEWKSFPNFNNTFACSSWDSTIRIYNFNHSLSLLSKVTTEDPCLSIAWMGQERLIGGSIDGKLHLVDIGTGSIMAIEGGAGHTDAINRVFYSEADGLAVSLSYDKTVKLWDLRQLNPVYSLNLGGKPYCADSKSGKLAIGLDNGDLRIFNIKNMGDSDCPGLILPLGGDEDLTDLCLYTSSTTGLSSFATSTCGRGFLTKIQENRPEVFTGSPVLTLKAHGHPVIENNVETSKEIVFPINTTGVHPSRDYAFTGAGDGNLIFWNLLEKRKCSTYSFGGIPVTKAKFSNNGQLVAYALGYDYTQGIQKSQSYPTIIGVHVVQPHDLKAEVIPKDFLMKTNSRY